MVGGLVRVPPMGRRVFLGAAAATVLACLDGCSAEPDYPAGPLRIASGGSGGVYHAYALGVDAVVRAALPRMRPTVLATAVSVENLRMVAAGQAEIGFTTADAAADGYRGRPPYTTALAVLALARIYDNYLHLAVRKDRPIATIADLRGRRISIGPPGSGTELLSTRVLASAGLDTAVHAEGLDPDVAADAVGSGRLDGMFFSGGIPTAAIAALAVRVPIALVDLGGYVGPLRAR